MSRTPRAYVATWIALLVLLALTAGSSFIPMGRWNLVTNLAIAVVKALLVILVFMELPKAATGTRLVAIGGLVWLALLAILGGADFAMR